MLILVFQTLRIARDHAALVVQAIFVVFAALHAESLLLCCSVIRFLRWFECLLLPNLLILLKLFADDTDGLLCFDEARNHDCIPDRDRIGHLMVIRCRFEVSLPYRSSFTNLLPTPIYLLYVVIVVFIEVDYFVLFGQWLLAVLRAGGQRHFYLRIGDLLSFLNILVLSIRLNVVLDLWIFTRHVF